MARPISPTTHPSVQHRRRGRRCEAKRVIRNGQAKGAAACSGLDCQISSKLMRYALHQLLALGLLRAMANATTKSHTVILHGKTGLVGKSFKANANAARATIRKGVLHCVRYKLIDDQA